MNKSPLPVVAAVLAAVCGLAALPAQAASIYLSPATHVAQPTDSQASFDLRMDFSAAEATLGGSVDLSLSGPITLADFTPSNYLLTVADPAFTGFGSARADGVLEVHFGHFNGLSGQHSLGTVNVNLTAPGTGRLDLATNSFWGSFYTVAGEAQNVALIGASVVLTPVPEPASALLLLAGAAALAGLQRRQSGAPTPA